MGGVMAVDWYRVRGRVLRQRVCLIFFIVQVQVVIVYTSALAAINRLCSLGLEQP